MTAVSIRFLVSEAEARRASLLDGDSPIGPASQRAYGWVRFDSETPPS